MLLLIARFSVAPFGAIVAVVVVVVVLRVEQSVESQMARYRTHVDSVFVIVLATVAVLSLQD